MDNVISQLVEIEKKAQTIAQQASDEEIKLQARINEAADRMRDEVKKATDAEIKGIHDSEATFANIRVEEISKQTQQQFAHLEDDFLKNHSIWEEELFNIIIGW